MTRFFRDAVTNAHGEVDPWCFVGWGFILLVVGIIIWSIASGPSF